MKQVPLPTQQSQAISSSEENRTSERMKMDALVSKQRIPLEVATPKDGSRRRQRSDGGKVEGKAYKLHFSCENKGRYFRSSKRRIRWLFGFTNLTAIESGQTGLACRGEEHEIDLVWSIKSGKTRICWNKHNISHLFRKGQKSAGIIDLSWETQSGHTIRVVAHSTAVAGVDRQYDLIVDGISYFRLPSVTELGRRRVGLSARASSDGSISHLESQSLSDELPLESFDYRLSMAGLGQTAHQVEVVDELHSEVYTSALETVRSHIVECLPQLESMVSRAVLDAFISDCKTDGLSQSSSSWSDSYCDEEVSQVELMALWEAFEWSRLSTGLSCQEEAEEQALLVMQKQITATFRRIRTEELQSHAATRILFSVAAMLGLEFASPIMKDTVLLLGLPGLVTTEELREILSPFGYVDSVAVSRTGTGFAFCRFVDEESPKRLRNAIRKGDLVIESARPQVVILSEGMELDFGAGQFAETRQDSEDYTPRVTAPMRVVRHDHFDSRSPIPEQTSEDLPGAPMKSPNSVMSILGPLTASQMPKSMFPNLSDESWEGDEPHHF